MKSFLAGVAVIVALGGGFVLGRFLPSRRPEPTSAPASRSQSQPRQEEEKPSTKAEVLSPAPKGFALTPATHDFGRLFEGEARSVELFIERPGGTALRMGRLYSPCPCISVDAAPLIVEAGKPAKVNVRVHSLTLEGKKFFPVYVELIEPAKGMLRADVSVDVERVPARILVVPEAFHFGSAMPGKSASAKLLNLTKYPLGIQELGSSIGGHSLELKGPKILAPGEAGELLLKLPAGGLPPGPIRGEVTVRTDSALHSVVKIPVDGTATK